MLNILKSIMPQSVARIFLNFSCPFPKSGYATHRLTHRRFLEIYKRLLKDGGEIHQKTDNMHFFEFSLEEFSHSGFALKNVSLNLHESGFEGNIMTEYEERFSQMGFPICRLVAKKTHWHFTTKSVLFQWFFAHWIIQIFCV